MAEPTKEPGFFTVLGLLALAGLVMLGIILLVVNFFPLAGVNEPFAKGMITGTQWYKDNAMPGSLKYNHTVDRACEGCIYVYDVKDKDGAPHVIAADLDIGQDCCGHENAFGQYIYGWHDWRSVTLDRGEVLYSYGDGGDNGPLLNSLCGVAPFLIVAGLLGGVSILWNLLFPARRKKDEENEPEDKK